MSSTRQDNLLAALQRKPTPVTAPVSTVQTPAAGVAEPVGLGKTAPRRVGKPVQFWMHEEDRRLIRELAAWLAGQGVRPTDSMVVRAALRMAKTNAAFLDAYRDAAQLDGRLRTRE
jgi:hypothetical protein